MDHVTPPGDVARRRRRLLLLGAALAALTSLDVLSLRAMWWVHEPERSTVEKTVFEHADDGTLTARGVAWSYLMLPQPRWLSADVLLLPPGYPVSLFLRRGEDAAFNVHVYEDRTPLVVLVKGENAAWQALVAVGGATRTLGVSKEAPAVSEFHGLIGCFGPQEPLVWHFKHATELVVEAGTCRWKLPVGEGQVVVDSYAAGARVQAETDNLKARPSIRWWMVLAIMLVALLHRAALLDPRLVLGDAAVTLVALLASVLTPLFIVLWGTKIALGMLAGVVWLGFRAYRHRGWAVGLGSVLALGALLAILVDPVWLAERNTIANERARARDRAPSLFTGRLTTRVEPDTTHLVLGYSTVNGAALAQGAYGDGAWDAVLRRTCGGASDVWARYALDGGNACFLVDTWKELGGRLPGLRRRVFIGGVNDDFTASSSARVILSTVMSLLPSTDPYPQPLAALDTFSRVNLEPVRREALLACTRSLAAADTRAPLLHVNDLPSFDLGRARRFGRDAWLEARRKIVEENGGTFVDMRSLIPGESPLYFNDFVHPSEVGYQQMARALCPQLRGPERP